MDKKRIYILVDKDKVKELKRIALDEDTSVTAIISRLADEYIDRKRREKERE